MLRSLEMVLLAQVVLITEPSTAWAQAKGHLHQDGDNADLLEEIEALKRRLEKLEAPREEVGEQEEKIEILASEIEQLKTRIVLPESKEYKSLYGFGPAASKVYQVERGLSIGGYGEFNYQNLVSDKGGKSDQFDFLRLVFYAGYKFSDRILLNTEIEFEHATSESTVASEDGSISVEFASLDFFLWEPLNVRAGLLLVPMGFINLVHEPPFFHGNQRPEVERRIIPTTWREGGVGIFGHLGSQLEYQAYLMNGLNAKGFSPTSGIRGGRQKGNRARAEDLAGTARLDWEPLEGLSLAASFFAGQAGQDQEFAGEKADVFTVLWELHGQWRYHGLELRTLGAFGHIGDAELLSMDRGETIASEIFGYYAEGAYDLARVLAPTASWYLAPFFRFEIFDTQAQVPTGFARAQGADVRLYTFGVTWKPHPQIVVKADYRNFDVQGTANRCDELNLGAGFIF